MDWYSGEKTNKVALKINSYSYVDPSRYFRPQPGDGQCRYYLYLNLSLVLKAGYLTGVVRLRAVREPIEDGTAYLDITVTRRNTRLADVDDDDSEEIDWLITHEWLGSSDDDYDSLRWDVRPGPEFSSASMTTRYAKAFVV
jgi:hypothetical protein